MLDFEGDLTDIGNAKRLVRKYGKEVRYCKQWRQWLWWDKVRWRVDETDAIMLAAQEVVRDLYFEAAAVEGNDDASIRLRRAIADWAGMSSSELRLKAMVELAKSQREIRMRAMDFDDYERTRWLLNCTNGVLDLRDGVLRTCQPEDCITKVTDMVCGYYEGARSELWERFLEEIQPEEEVRRYLQKAVGYSLTGSVEEQCMFFLYGTGANGKTTFTEPLLRIMGGYAQRAPSSLIASKNPNAIPNDVARLRGARFVVASELEGGARLREALVKDLTGGDTLVARFLYAELFEFRPTHKIWMYGNHKPIVRGTDEGLWRRLRLIPFEQYIPPERQNRSLVNQLSSKEEAPGILAWAVEGCKMWMEDGLGLSPTVVVATEGYRKESDVIGDFLNTCCVICDAKSAETGKHIGVKRVELYVVYKDWALSNGYHPMSSKGFGAAMTERGSREIVVSGSNHYKDITLKGGAW